MYKFLLIRKYLLKRRIAWVSLIAVALCTTMVLVVISVFGGWMRMFQELNHGLVGDIIVSDSTNKGFGHYEEMLKLIRDLKAEGVTGAVPVIHTYALLNIEGQIPNAVQVYAYGDLDQIDKVNQWHVGLYRQYQEVKDEIQNDPTLSSDQRKNKLIALDKTPPNFNKKFPPDEYVRTYERQHPDANIDYNEVKMWQGLIAGIGTVGIHKGANNQLNRGDYMDLVYHSWARLTLLDMNSPGTFTPVQVVPETYWIVDDSRTGIYAIDNQTVYVPFDDLQKNLDMTAHPYTRISDNTDQVDPARVNEIQIGCTPGTDLKATVAKIKSIVTAISMADFSDNSHLSVQTWYERQAEYLDAVEHEKVLTVILFSIISIVSIFLIFCIFFMIVVEKTRDIGIIKSVGATSNGVAGIFLGYGLTIGLIGGGLGLLFGYLVVHNINPLHAWVAHVIGVQIWNPETYVFDQIPNTMDPWETTVIVSIAVLSALLGAIVPAIRAARMHPVEALRWE